MPAPNAAEAATPPESMRLQMARRIRERILDLLRAMANMEESA